MKTLSLLLFMAPFLAAQPCQLADLPSDSNLDGALAATDCAVKDVVRAETSVTRADGWKLVVKESRVFRFRMVSTELDPYLWLLRDRGAVIARDNDGGGGKDAEFSVQLSPGAYTLLASLNGTGSGAYRVEVSNTAPRKCKIEPLAEGAEIESDLVDTDCRNLDLTPFTPDPIPVDVYRLEFARPVVLTVSMDSDGFRCVPGHSLGDKRDDRHESQRRRRDKCEAGAEPGCGNLHHPRNRRKGRARRIPAPNSRGRPALLHTGQPDAE